MFYAVNVADLQSWAVQKGQFAGPVLLLRPVLTAQTVQCEGERFDGDSVLVKDDVPPERWAAIMELIRKTWKLHQNRDLRIYQSKTGKGGWKRI